MRHRLLPLLFALTAAAIVFAGCAGESENDTVEGIETTLNGRVSSAIDISCEKVPQPGNSEPEQPEGVSPAVMMDAQTYADDFGVELGEAVVRLQGQEIIGRLGSSIQANEPGTYAGHWIQHEPQYRMVVLFTRDGGSTICPYIEGHPLFDIVEVRSAEVTLAELERSQAEAMSLTSEAEIRAESSINVFQNLVELYITDVEQLGSALERAGLSLPDHVRVVPVSSLSEPEN